MRHPRLLLPVLLALATAACSSQKPDFYVTDSATGQRVATGPQNTPLGERGFFSSSSSRAGGAYAYAATPTRTDAGGRGLLNSDIFSSRSHAPVYVYPAQPQPPQTYSYHPPPQQTYAPPASNMQYRPPQPARQPYAQQPYQPPQHYQQQPQRGGYYAERYRWY